MLKVLDKYIPAEDVQEIQYNINKLESEIETISTLEQNIYEEYEAELTPRKAKTR